MINYTNEKKFIDWYKENTGKEKINENEILNDAYLSYCMTGKGEYTIKAPYSVTKEAVTYQFEVENIGCCGASTMYIHF